GPAGLQVEDGRHRGKSEVPDRKNSEAGRQDQLVEKARPPEAAEEEEGGGRSRDCGRRLERNVERGGLIGEVEACDESECRCRTGPAERTANQKPPQPQHDTSPSLIARGKGPVFWAGQAPGSATRKSHPTAGRPFPAVRRTNTGRVRASVKTWGS